MQKKIFEKIFSNENFRTKKIAEGVLKRNGEKIK